MRFCRDHRCAHPSCSEYVRPNADPAKRDSHERYCEKDRPCKTTGCSERAHRLRSGKVLSHCKDHYCDYEHECDDERSVGGTGCEKHTCRDPGCNKKLTDTEAAIYCEDHECKTKQCWGRKYQNVVRSDRCTQHICRDYLRERCEKEGDVRYEYYCDLHQRCEVDGCNEARHQEKGVMRPRCQKREQNPPYLPVPSHRQQSPPPHRPTDRPPADTGRGGGARHRRERGMPVEGRRRRVLRRGARQG